MADCSWAINHAVLIQLNDERILCYSYRMYEVASEEADECAIKLIRKAMEEGKSWQASCTRHTIHRVSNDVDETMTPSLNINARRKSLYSSGLLLTTLSVPKQIWQLMNDIFESEYETETT